MSYTRVVESRVFDSVYDPVFTTPYTAPTAAPAGFSEQVRSGALVGGTSRHKFFSRPVVPHLDAVAPEVLLAPTEQTDPMQPPDEEPESRTKEAQVQTKYRDSEAQTNPYTPAFVLAADQPEPEVLMLEGLTHERGLPVGRREIEMIAHAKQKRALEAALPPTTDESSLALRKRLMEAQELREFAMRQREMDAAHAARLDVLRAAVSERDEGNEFLAEQVRARSSSVVVGLPPFSPAAVPALPPRLPPPHPRTRLAVCDHYACHRKRRLLLACHGFRPSSPICHTLLALAP